MTTERVTTLLDAEDRASAKFAAAGGALQRAFGPEALKRTLLSMVSFSAILGGLGISVSVVIGKLVSYFKEVQAANRAVARLSDQMRLSGFTIAQTTKRMDELRNSMTRANLIALAAADKGLQKFFELLGPEAQADILATADALEELGVSSEKALEIALEAGAGNLAPLEEVLNVDPGTFKTISDGMEEVNTQVQTMLDNRGPIEKYADAFMEGLGIIGRAVMDFIIMPIVEDFTTTVMTIGPNILKLISLMSGLLESGKAWALNLVTGFVDWLLGTDAVAIITAALDGNWGLVWEKAMDMVLGWGKSIGTFLLDGWKAFMDSDFVGWLQEHIFKPIADFVTGAIPRFLAFGKALGTAIGNGLIDTINWVIKNVVAKVNSWISKAVAAFNRFLPAELRINTPQLSGTSIGRLGANTAVGSAGAGAVPTATPTAVQAPLKLEVNGKTLASVVVEAINGSIRILNPGLR